MTASANSHDSTNPGANPDRHDLERGHEQAQMQMREQDQERENTEAANPSGRKKSWQSWSLNSTWPSHPFPPRTADLNHGRDAATATAAANNTAGDDSRESDKNNSTTLTSSADPDSSSHRRQPSGSNAFNFSFPSTSIKANKGLSTWKVRTRSRIGVLKRTFARWNWKLNPFRDGGGETDDLESLGHDRGLTESGKSSGVFGSGSCGGGGLYGAGGSGLLYNGGAAGGSGGGFHPSMNNNEIYNGNGGGGLGGGGCSTETGTSNPRGSNGGPDTFGGGGYNAETETPNASPNDPDRAMLARAMMRDRHGHSDGGLGVSPRWGV
ncbi:hypothetical protein K402DRAFT_73525 [Aulographum hederae CBS 113979]|uniref:Uncharacterized protein n=1 Tax=Aulographum hederae CBS 113979 TaxID=1176131 RepID=A0A6G1HFA5_9PEZI|nr:hypothetical protein K402DRAFT_73525 [Aulographum hederae CBS 113979]